MKWSFVSLFVTYTSNINKSLKVIDLTSHSAYAVNNLYSRYTVGCLRGTNMRKQMRSIILAGAGVVLTLCLPQTAMAVNNSTFNQTINAGVLSTDMLDASQVTVASPSVAMTAKSLSFACQSGGSASTGTFGTNAQRIYVMNPGGANNGWTLTLAATSGATTTWVSGGNSFDFNDPTTSGCGDGADADTKSGQLTVDPSVGTLTADCASCALTNVTKGTSTAFLQATTDSVTLLNAALSSDDIWRGYLTGVGLSQTIPAETPAGAYTINMTLTATAL
jgi:hypothetical protein